MGRDVDEGSFRTRKRRWKEQIEIRNRLAVLVDMESNFLYIVFFRKAKDCKT